jgi:hypothetical protein
MWILGALSLFELCAFAVFILALAVATSFDSHNDEPTPKWGVLAVGFVLLAVWYWSSWTFIGDAVIPAVIKDGKVIEPEHTRVVLWELVRSAALWVPIGWYFALGAVYAIAEFGYDIVKSVRYFKDHWATFLTRTRVFEMISTDGGPVYLESEPNRRQSREYTYAEMLAELKEKGAFSRFFEFMNGELQRYDTFRSGEYGTRNKIIGVRFNAETFSMEPKVYGNNLTENLAAWCTLWPAYFLSLVFGDLLMEGFRAFGRVMKFFSRGLVKFSFRNVFKF